MTTQSATDRRRPAQSRFVEVPSISGRAQVLVTGEGPRLPMVLGGAIRQVAALTHEFLDTH